MCETFKYMKMFLQMNLLGGGLSRTLSSSSLTGKKGLIEVWEGGDDGKKNGRRIIRENMKNMK